MTDQPAAPHPDEEPADLEYDLAHEAVADLDSAAPSQPARAPASDVATRTGTYGGGDYGYDLAHDIPPG